MNFDKVFISHRSFDYAKAVELKDFLIKNRISQNVVLWENETLCRNYEQLTVHEYFEAIEKIKKTMIGCNYFFYIDSPGYFNGYFTGAEILQWRIMKENPVIYKISKQNGELGYSEIQLQPIDKRTRKRISFTSYKMNPEYMFFDEVDFSRDVWGKYARNCFLVGCCACGRYYLITRKRMAQYVARQELVECPYCHKYHAVFYQDLRGKKYFSNRYPIIMIPKTHKIEDLKPLSLDDVIDLLDAKQLPNNFALQSLPDEKLRSEYKEGILDALKIGAKAILGVVTIVTVLNTFGGSKDEA